MWVYGSAEGDRRTGGVGTALVPAGPVYQYAVPVLREEQG